MGYQIGNRIVSRREYFAHAHGDDFAELLEVGGYAISDSSDPRALVWKPGARGLSDNLDDFIAPSLGAEPLRFGTLAMKHQDPPAFIARRIYCHDTAEWEAKVKRERKAHKSLKPHFLLKSGKVSVRDLASVEALRRSIQDELDHRADRASVWTEKARRVWAVPLIEMEAKAQQTPEEPLTDEGKSTWRQLLMIWDEVREGERLDLVLSRIGYWSTQSPAMPRSAWERVAISMTSLLAEREPELKLAHELVTRLTVINLILRAAAFGREVTEPGEREYGPLEVEIGRALYLDRVRHAQRGYLRFDRVSQLCDWAYESLSEAVNPRVEMMSEPSSILTSLKRSGHWNRNKRGPSNSEEVAALVVTLVNEYHDWQRRIE